MLKEIWACSWYYSKLLNVWEFYGNDSLIFRPKVYDILSSE
jgi:hypothetical protein